LTTIDARKSQLPKRAKRRKIPALRSGRIFDDHTEPRDALTRREDAAPEGEREKGEEGEIDIIALSTMVKAEQNGLNDEVFTQRRQILSRIRHVHC
jgi:hypothetical protein